jgi:hypothetical protein
MDGPHSFCDFGLRGSEMSILPILRIRETLEPQYADGLSYRDFFPKASISAMHPLKMDTPHPFHDFMKSNAKMSWHFVSLIPEVPNSEMQMAPDLRHMSQPMDGSDMFRGFHRGDS